ncbi:MAG: heme exporter protein CcmD [Enterobacterales bacterium]|nr:heme exporter protein CcmD [Enterobacterales bacterium]
MTLYFQTFQDFIDMGGHGFFVWTSYAFCFVGLLGYFIYSNNLSQSNKKELVKFYRKLTDREQRLAKHNHTNDSSEVNE